MYGLKRGLKHYQQAPTFPIGFSLSKGRPNQSQIPLSNQKGCVETLPAGTTAACFKFIRAAAHSSLILIQKVKKSGKYKQPAVPYVRATARPCHCEKNRPIIISKNFLPGYPGRKHC
jgi:hypothetical protein